MKKMKLLSMATIAMMFATACSSKSAADATTDSADSAVIEVADTVATDTVAAEPEPEPVVPTEALTLKPGKKNLKYAPEASFKTGTFIVNVTNTSNVAVSGDAYKVSYQETVEESNDEGMLDDKTYTRTVAGKDVAPGETVEITIKAGEGCQDLTNPKIVNAK